MFRKPEWEKSDLLSDEVIQKALVEKMKSREGKNSYTQSEKRDQVAEGYSDCSSLTRWVYQEVLGIDIGEDTVEQIVSPCLETVEVPIRDGVPEKSALRPGDLLFFRGQDCERKAAYYVGHVEMYEGNGTCIGHGEGMGPVRKELASYCRQRQALESPVPAGNQGLICVRRQKILKKL